MYAPVTYWRNKVGGWIKSRSWADCHKFINEHDDELVREVLEHSNSDLLGGIAMNSQVYTPSCFLLFE